MGLNKDIGCDDFCREVNAFAVLCLVGGKRRRLRIGAGAIGAGFGETRVQVASHVIPGPAVEAVLLDRSYVVWDKMVAERVSLIGGTPKLSGCGIDGFANAIPQARSVNLDELPLGCVFEDVCAMELAGMGIGVISIGAGAYGDKHMLAVFTENDIARPVAASGELGVAGNIGDDGLSSRGGVHVAGAIRESLDGGGIAHVNVPGVVGGIEGDAEGVIKAGGELLDLSGLAVRSHAAKNKESSCTGVGKKEIAVRRGADQARHGKSSLAERHLLLVVSALHGG